MADTKTKRKIARTKIEDGTASFMLYGVPNEDGEQTIDRTLAFDPADINPAITNAVLSMGFAAAFQNQYQKLRDSDVDPDATADLFNKLLAAMKDGTWTPGRSFDEGEPDDIVLALAEATGRPVHVIAEEIETRMVKDNNGNLVRDKRGRTRRFFNAKMLENLARDPKVSPIMARLAKEKAERMNKDARGNKGGTSKLGSLFGEPEAVDATADQAIAAN